MTVERHFVISGWWVSIGPSPAPGTHNLLQVQVWDTDPKTGDPVSMKARLTITRNQLFDFACGILCTVLEAEPEGVFDTSYALDANTRSLGLTDNVKELLRLTQTEDPSKAYTQTMRMFRRLENRLPVLQACQRALEVCDSEFEVNQLMELASKLERGVAIPFWTETHRSLNDDITSLDGSGLEGDGGTRWSSLGFKIIPSKAVTGSAAGRWLRAVDPTASSVARAASSINAFLWEGTEGQFQIRTDLVVSPDCPEADRIFSPLADLETLEHFCKISWPAFERMSRDNRALINTGEAPIPSHSFKVLLRHSIE